MQELSEAHRLRTDSKKRTTIKGGRPKKDADPDHADFRVAYCEALLNTKSRVKACEATPYDYNQIYQMLNEKYSSYDAEFAEMVHKTEARLVAWAEETIWNALEDETKPKDKAWIAKEILKVRDRDRWGDKLQMDVHAQVQHRMVLDRGRMLAELAEEQKRFFANVPTTALPAGEEIVVEAENNE